MKIRNNIIFSIAVTAFWTIFIFWNRFVRERLPRNLVEINPLSTHFIIVLLLFVYFLSLAIYSILLYLRIIPRPNSRIKLLIEKAQLYLNTKAWYKEINSFIEEHIINGPQNVYDNIIYRKIYLKDFIHSIGSQLTYYFEASPFIPYIMGFVLPKIIPAVIMFIELIFSSVLIIFYKSLLLLLIPLLLNLVLYMINHHSRKCIDWYKQYFDFEYDEETDTVHVFFKDLLNPTKEDLEKQERFSERAADEWAFYQYLHSISYKIKYKQEVHRALFRSIFYVLMTTNFAFYLLILLGIFK